MHLCPACGNEILIYRSRGGFSLVCLRCRLGGEVEAKSEGEAHSSFLSSYREGEFLPQPLKALKGELEREGMSYEELPEVLKQLFTKQGESPVIYRIFRGKEPERGRHISKLSLNERLESYLRRRGLSRLYRFQEEALKLAREGRHLLIEAPTGSGKTEAFTLPIVDKILSSSQEGTQAVFIYPTKALARDQAAKFRTIEGVTGVKFRVFDGDTPGKEREEILRERPEVIVTNPDILNLHLTMPWSELKGLATEARYLVVDEVHSYTGAFGTHLHYLIKRLKRFSNIQIIGSSATIGNPERFGKLLFSSQVEVVREEGGRRGLLHFAMLYPEERSSFAAMVIAMGMLQRRGCRTLVFANSHRSAELLYRAARRSKLSADLHRAGLSIAKRHSVERRFKQGKLGAVIATPTLELGIDIGEVDSVVSALVNFTRLFQRVGRAGRKGQESIALLFLNSRDPISSYYRNHPEDYFGDFQPCYIEPRNQVIAEQQVLSAASDMPLAGEEFRELDGVKRKLVKAGELLERGGYLVPSRQSERRARRAGIRGVGEKVSIKFRGREIGDRELPIALRELHPGAIYLHAGESYRSRELNFSSHGGYAQVVKAKEEVKTEALRHSIPKVVEVLERRSAFGIELSYARLDITEVVRGYVERKLYTNQKLGEFELPEELHYTFPSYGFFFRAPEPRGLQGEEGVEGSFHALEHIIIEGSNPLLGGGSGEIGGVSLGSTGIIFVYDGALGGNGISRLLYERFEKAAQRCTAILEECSCRRRDGCPRCTYSYQCGNNNSSLLKPGALSSLQKMLSGERTEVREIEDYRGYV